MIHHISSEWLTIDKVSQLLQPGVKLELSDDARSRIIRCREYLDNKMKIAERAYLRHYHRLRLTL